MKNHKQKNKKAKNSQKNKSRLQYYDIDIFDTKFFLATSKKMFNEMQKIMKIKKINRTKITKDEDTFGICKHIGVSRGRSNVVIIVGVFDKKITTLVHETMHAIRCMLECRSIDMSTYSGNEIAAYSQEKLFEKFYKHIDNKRYSK